MMLSRDMKPGQLLKIINTNRTPAHWVGEHVVLLKMDPWASDALVLRGERKYEAARKEWMSPYILAPVLEK